MQATIWDWERGEVVRTHRHLRHRARRVRPDRYPDRDQPPRRGVADVWDARTGDRVATLTAPAEIGDITFGPDGTTVATGHADGTVRLWNTETGAQQLVLRGRRRARRPRRVQPGRLQARLGG